MNFHRFLALAGQALVGGAVYVGGTAGYAMGVVGALLNMFANADKVKPQAKDETPDNVG